jgi:hypothetical protein
MARMFLLDRFRVAGSGVCHSFNKGLVAYAMVCDRNEVCPTVSLEILDGKRGAVCSGSATTSRILKPAQHPKL